MEKTSASVLAMSSGPGLQRSLELAGTGGGLEWRVIPNRKGVSFVVDGYVLNLDCADGCPTRGMYEIH